MAQHGYVTMAHGARKLRVIGLARLVTDGHGRFHEITNTLGDAGNKLSRFEGGCKSLLRLSVTLCQPQFNGRWQRRMPLAVGG